MRKVAKQLDHHEAMLKDRTDAKALLDSGRALKKSLTDWEANLVEGRIQNVQDVINWPSKLNVEYFNIKSVVDAAEPQVTQGVRNRLADLDKQWQSSKSEMEILKQRIAAYNRIYQQANIPALQMK
jgi:hypothetical protein